MYHPADHDGHVLHDVVVSLSAFECPRWNFVMNWPVDTIIIIIRMIIRRSLVVSIIIIPGIVILIILILEVVVCCPNNTLLEGMTQQRFQIQPRHPQSDTHNQPIQAQSGH